ncbi:MAG TPA: assimilatory sulfite reductase (NADPH) flavoprotein subunit [Gammaproteobacteria bacterium]|nr:assimilatory sulfite reductase (NADPH) flavoprotein subunit [Gammaproteobacteria bacterium]
MLPQSPVPPETLQQLAQLSPAQQAFLAGYLWANSQSTASVHEAPTAAAPARKITVISASQTGNAAGVAKQFTDKLKGEKLDATLVAAGNYKARQLPKEDIVVIITSTQGEGEPPEEGVPLHHFLFGKKAPKMDGVSFAVFGLGDSSYPDFCQAGKDFDTQLAALGGERLIDRGDADLDFQATADAWIDSATQKLKNVAGGANVTPLTLVTNNAAEAHAESAYNKETPYTAALIQHSSLATADADKEVEHIEIDLGDSGITYAAGDALGVYTNNASDTVDEVLARSGLTGDETVESREGKVSIRQVLTEQSDLNQLTPQFITQYAERGDSEALSELVADRAQLLEYQAWTPLLGLLHDHPQQLPAQTLYDGLKPLTPRLYSIASAQEEVGEEVHLCVGVVDIHHHDQVYYGSASGLLSKRLDEGDDVRVFVEPNPRFRLPQDAATPIIMIGAGTGIAPYRSFLQQRSADEAEGKNWLIFGNRHFRKDFLYHAEWLAYRDQGLLHETSLAWSRDGEEKVYVQDKIRENGDTFWQWLQDGAHIYVCGDATRMAKDVEQAILDVIGDVGKLSADDATEFLNDLREADRYQRDVY